MTSIEKAHNRLILLLIGIGVILIATCSFVLSFHNLCLVAESAGIESAYTPLWPLSVDVFLAVATLFILRASIMEESSRQGWAVLLIFTGISVVFNISNSPTNLISQAAHAIPPISLCISLELLMSILRSDLRGTESHLSANMIRTETPSQKSESYSQSLRGTESFAETPLSDNELITESLSVAERVPEMIRNYFISNPENSIKKASEDLKISWATVSKYRPK